MTKRQQHILGLVGRHAGIAVAVGLILGTVGPFGTFAELTPGDRYVYWLSIMALNWGQIVLAAYAVARATRGRRWPWWAEGLAAAALASVPATFEVMVLEQWLRGYGPAQLPALPVLYAYVFILTAVVVLGLYATLGRFLTRPPADDAVDAPREAAQGAAAPATPPSFLAPLVDQLGDELLCLQTEDHYLRVHTSRGSALILHRLRDAQAELGQSGLQVHRSWWVADGAVARSERDGRRLLLVLRNELRVPVSRRHLPAVRDAGWL